MPSTAHGPPAAAGPWVLSREAGAQLCPWEHWGLLDPTSSSLSVLQAPGAALVLPQGERCTCSASCPS